MEDCYFLIFISLFIKVLVIGRKNLKDLDYNNVFNFIRFRNEVFCLLCYGLNDN